MTTRKKGDRAQKLAKELALASDRVPTSSALGLCQLLECLDKGYYRRRNLLFKLVSNSEFDEEGCLIWQGGDSGEGRGGGYGRISYEGRSYSTHRLMWEICNGPIPSKKQIDHKCKKRRCINPECLQLTTHKRNQKLRDERR